MASELTEWTRAVLYPALYPNIGSALPELNLQHRGKAWEGPLKLDGTAPKQPRRDKVKVREASPGWIFEEGDPPGMSIADYVMDRDGSQWIDAVRRLATFAGLQVPTREVDPALLRAQRERAGIMEELSGFFAWTLWDREQGPAGRDAARDYLGARGWTTDKGKEVGIGFAPTVDKIREHLTGKGYNIDGDACKFLADGRVGASHPIVIPWRSGGQVRGFVFRAVDPSVEPKYINGAFPTGETLLGLRHGKKGEGVLIVEGLLDALTLQANNLGNVAATGGTSLTPAHAAQLAKLNPSGVVLCFDADAPGRIATAKAIDVLREHAPRLSVTVATLPSAEGVKMDPDQYVRENGVESFKALLSEARASWRYLLDGLLSEYAGTDTLTDAQTSALVARAVEQGAAIPSPTDRDLHRAVFLDAVKGAGITDEALRESQDRLRFDREREEQARQMREALTKSRASLDAGNVAEAIASVEDRLSAIRSVRGASLVEPITPSAWFDAMATTGETVRTGLDGLDELTGGLAVGALTYVAGRPRHGKTTVLMNIARRLVLQGKGVLFYSYEERAERIATKILTAQLGINLLKVYPDHFPGALNTYAAVCAYLKQGGRDIAELERAREEVAELMRSGLLRVVGTRLPVESLRASIESLSKGGDVAAILVDYVQRIPVQKEGMDIRPRLMHVSDQLLQASLSTDLPFVVGSQFGRAAADAGRPKLEHLKESGAIEEDANTVFGVWNEAAEGDKRTGFTPEIELTALKFRDGEPNKTAHIAHDPETLRLLNRGEH